MNQDVSYRQGMHELLAPILWVVDKESIPGSNGYATENGEDMIIRQTLNADYVEHDTFALFSALMKDAKVYYEYNEEIFNRRPVRVCYICLDKLSHLRFFVLIWLIGSIACSRF
jgi:TBC1 domain family protein 5